MELKWTLQYSQTVWSPRGTPPRLSWVLFSRIRREVFPDSVGDGMAVVDWSVSF